MKMKRDKVQQYKTCASAVLIIAFVLVLAITSNQSIPIDTEKKETQNVDPQGIPQQVTTNTIFSDALNAMNMQNKRDKELIKELRSGEYSLKKPLVVLDPYESSPLTALLLFSTDEPTTVSISINGDDDFTVSGHTFNELRKEHTIPIVGLYADRNNRVDVTITKENGEVVEKNTIEIETEPLPEDLENLAILTNSFSENYQQGINYLYEGRKFAFDKNGGIRWYLQDTDLLLPVEYNYSENRIIVAKGDSFQGNTVFYEIDRLGKIYSVYHSPYGAHHDIIAKKNGDLLVTGSDGKTVEDFVYEIDIKNGDIVHTVDFKKLLQRSRASYVPGEDEGSYGLQDWLHNNSIMFTEDEKSVIVSSNYQSAVIKLSWPEGEIQWILSSPDEWMPRLKQYLLKPVGNGFEYSYNQHAVEILPDYDNNSDTTDIMLFDNGASRFIKDKELQRKIRNNQIVAPELYSRMVQYRINEKDMTVEQIWQYGKERGKELYSYARGDADLLHNGNRLGFFFRAPNNIASAVISEVDGKSSLVWEAEIFTNSENGNYWNYRAERLPFYAGDEKEQDITTEARNMIPKDILKKYCPDN